MSTKGPNKKAPPQKKDDYTADELRIIREIAESYERHNHDYQRDPDDQPRLTQDDVKRIAENKKTPKK